MKISLVITCSDKKDQNVRLGHLQQTLEQNLRDNPSTADMDVEFVLLNYGDKAGLHEWVMAQPFIRNALESGHLVYARTTEPKFFKHAPAKNMGARIAIGDVICNLDADNFTGKGFAQELHNIFMEDINAIAHPSYAVMRRTDPTANGFFGRIAMSSRNFYRLGGYDESYQGWGEEDTNLIHRARMLGLKHVQFEESSFLGVIPHGDEVRVANTVDSEAAYSKELARLAKRHKKDQREFSCDLISRGGRKLKAIYDSVVERLPTLLTYELTANSGKYFGMGNITVFSADDNCQKMTLGSVEKDRAIEFNSVSGALRLIKTHFQPKVISFSSNPASRPQ